MTKIKKHGEIDEAAKMIADWRSMMVAHAVYEHGPLRYTSLSDMLEMSPTVLSGKLSQLASYGIIRRHQQNGAKEVVYEAEPLCKNMVKAYHLLEKINDSLFAKTHGKKEGV